MNLLGVDTGGTFTDFAYYDGAAVRIHKVLSTPEAPESAILQGISDMALAIEDLVVVHGSTVATNAVLEGKGVRTVYISNKGLKDVLHIGRQARSELYNLQPQPVSLPLAPDSCLEMDARLGANGQEIKAVDPEELARLVRRVQDLAPDAVAVNLLFSFLDDRHEQALARALPGDLFVSLSSSVLPEYREYERGMATWLNAYVGPLMQGYLQRLQTGLAGAHVSVMQSSADTLAANQAANNAVRLLLSGPAGGLAAARTMGQLSATPRMLTFDMGGTSTDVALVDGEPRLTSEGHIGSYPVAVPMVDMHTIGAGGGSIARVDAGGLLLVGPESAGASPGPACYGQGGQQATVTDANLVLGRLQPGEFLGGKMRLDKEAAWQAVAAVARQLECSTEQAALGIVQVANEHMAQALRVISVQRGEDPAEYTLVSFGGAGGLHVCALADALGMTSALVPVHAGVLSALGMLVAPPGRQLSRTVNGPLADCDPDQLESLYDGLEAQGRRALQAEGIDPETLRLQRSVDLRYVGQSYTLNVPWQGIRGSSEGFHVAHQQRYGHGLDVAVELVNLRVSVRGHGRHLALQTTPATGEAEDCEVDLYGCESAAKVYRRDQLGSDRIIPGPALVTEAVSTTFVAPGWQCQPDGHGNLRLSRVTV
jgi:N-methylhydantoinase A